MSSVHHVSVSASLWRLSPSFARTPSTRQSRSSTADGTRPGRRTDAPQIFKSSRPVRAVATVSTSTKPESSTVENQVPKGELLVPVDRPANDEAPPCPFPPNPRLHLVFVYGTLKKGFYNYTLVQEALDRGGAFFLGTGQTKEKYPLVVPGPFQVPFLLDLPSRGRCVFGELYAVDDVALAAFDVKEGVTMGYYSRKTVDVVKFQPHSKVGEAFCRHLCEEQGVDGVQATPVTCCYAYFEGGHNTHLMAQLPCLPLYRHEDAACYVGRPQRPAGCCFVGSTREWLQQQFDAGAEA
eukprot:jgi/Mesvir1/23217/Mv22675-RA.1